MYVPCVKAYDDDDAWFAIKRLTMNFIGWSFDLANDFTIFPVFIDMLNEVHLCKSTSNDEFFLFLLPISFEMTL